jgi:hypothetical protein
MQWGPPGSFTVDITVVTPTGTSPVTANDHFLYNAASGPTISAMSPTSGSAAGGTVVVITGSNFTNATSVTFGGTAAGFTVNSDSMITATVPAGAPGTVTVQVTTPFGPATTSFTYTTVGSPTVSSVTPPSGSSAGGTVVVILGSHFTGATGVTFGNNAATSFTVNSDTSITVIAPNGSGNPPGAVNVTVTTPSGNGSKNGAFTYIAPNAPTVSQVSPASGFTTGGTVVILTGQYFTGATAVTVGNYPATSFYVNSDTQLTAVLPPEAAATVNIAVTTAGGTSTTGGSYTYNATGVAPTISSVSPNSGPTSGGTVVLVTGSNFLGATAVTFGGVAATSFTVLSNTYLIATSPAGSPGTVYIQVTTYAGPTANGTSDQFTYQSGPSIFDPSLRHGDGPIAATPAPALSGSAVLPDESLGTTGVGPAGVEASAVPVVGSGTAGSGATAATATNLVVAGTPASLGPTTASVPVVLGGGMVGTGTTVLGQGMEAVVVPAPVGEGMASPWAQLEETGAGGTLAGWSSAASWHTADGAADPLTLDGYFSTLPTEA